SILIGEGNGTFQTHADSATGQQPYDVAIADFNGDGKPDLASANFAANSASILLNQGSGKFAAHVDYPTGYAPGALAIADFNGDKKQDLALAATGSNAVSILMGNGDGTFQALQEYPTGNLDIGIAVGDFTGNGVADVVTSNSGFGANSVSILLGTGSGAFKPFVNYASGFFPLWTAAADFNGDGKLDLAVADYDNVELGFAFPSQVSILLGNGDGTFQSPIIYDVGEGAQWIAAGDFNQDGKQDLAVVNGYGNTVSILLGNGDGTFQPQVSYAVGAEPFSVAVADFNGDGTPDLAVSNSICIYESACGPGTVSILLGNGDGTFQPDVEYVAALEPSGLAAGDLSGQGGADVAVANLYSNSVSVLFNLPVISVFPNSVAFGKEAVGKKSAPHIVTIGNPSGTPLSITSVKIAGADPGDFAETDTCPISPAKLAPGATCAITVTFTAAASGKRSGKIELTDTVPGSPQSITLTGSGK
ncbi:MAG: FG-GAP-like repeat-containing protein, partial [Bryobacteraceae bacterium]